MSGQSHNMEALGSRLERRTFKKSFNGCKECRQRKVKCDEVHPICGRCSRHFKNPRPCDWGASRSSVPIRSRNRYSPPHPTSQSLTPSLPNPIGTTKMSFSLRLFYHYLKQVAPSFPQAHNANVREMWTVDVPQLAFECDYLLNGTLSVAALHLHLTRAPEDTTLLKASRLYFDTCIKAFQDAIGHLDHTNAESTFLTGTILLLLSYPLSRPADSMEPYQPPTFAMHLTKALETLRERTGRWLDESNVGALIQRQVRGSEDLPKKKFLREEEKTDLLALLNGLDLDSAEAEIYREAIEHVIVLQDAAVDGESEAVFQRKFVLFAFMMSPEFMALLDQQDPRALVIFAHHICMAKFLDGVWYLEGMADYDVPGIYSILPDEWRDMMRWPLYIIGRDERAKFMQSMPRFAITELRGSG